MASVADLVAKYSHAAAAQTPGANLEVEIRFDQTDFDVFRVVAGRLLDAAAAAPPLCAAARLHVLDTIQDEPEGRKRSKRVWERRFLPAGGRENVYYRKEQLSHPARVRPAEGLPYRVGFAREDPIPPFPTNDVIFRAKARLSFTFGAAPEDSPFAALAHWRLDASVVHTLPKSAAASLPAVVGEMFKDGRPADLFTDLNLEGAKTPTASQTANRRRYVFEIEIEYVGPPSMLTAARIAAAADAVQRVIDPSLQEKSKARALLREAAALVYDSPGMLQKFETGEWGLKQFGPNPVTLNRATYNDVYPPVGMFLTRKADGLHAVAVVKEGRLTVIAPGLEPAIAGAAPRPGPGAGAVRPGLTVADGEIAPVRPPAAGAGADADAPAWVFLAFDLLALDGKVLASAPYEERFDELEAAVRQLALFMPARRKEAVQLEARDPKTLKLEIEPLLAPADYPTDGLIFTTPGAKYLKTAHLKWKPFSENTIDFLVRRPPASVLGRPPFADAPGCRLYFLFVGISGDQYRRFNMTLCPGYRELFPEHARTTGYFPVQFQASDAPYAYLAQVPEADDGGANNPIPLENRIVELALDSEADIEPGGVPGAPRWRFVRVRTDRDEDLRQGRLFGNNYATAELTWLNFRDPLTLEMLSAGPGGAYFQAPKQGIYAAPTAFMSAAKTEVVRRHVAGLGFVVDLGSGKGQDLGRYRQAQVPQVLMVDKDPAALAELVRRKHAAGRGPAAGRVRTRLHVARADFTAPHAAVAGRLRAVPDFPAAGADAVVCNLAAHYAFETEASVANFARLVRGLLRPGGQLLLVLLDGQAVLNLFTQNKVAPGESWDLRENGALKYSLRRYFREDRLTAAGQAIGVLLPFSQGEHYTEYLSNVVNLQKVFAALDMPMKEYRNLWEEFGKNDAPRRGHLTENDVQWLRLFIFLRFERAK